MALTDKLTAIGNAIRSKTGGNSSLTLPQMATTISALIAPKKYTYNQMNEKVNDYITNVTYNPSDYTTSSISTYTTTTSYRKDRPNSLTINLPSSGTLVISDGENSSIKYSVAAAGNFTIDNLIPNITYIYTLYDTNDNILEAGSILPTGQIRMINGGGNTLNIRDLGGWLCDGGTLKYGLIFRGCELNANNDYVMDLTPDQIKLFTEFLKISEEIDLREKEEISGDDGIYETDDDITSSALGSSVDYALYRIGYYGARNDVQRERYTGCINRIVADVTKKRPIYLHCVAGTDRTGTICALIEGLCGVSQSDVDKDYELSSLSGYSAVRNRDAEVSYKSFITSITTLPGNTFRDHVIAYVLQLGVTIENINALRNALINGNPAAVRSPYETVTLTASMSHVNSSNSTAPRLYEPYTTTLTPAEGYDSISDVTVIMDGVEITIDSYSDGVVNIPRVTGDIAISAVGVAGYTNLIPTSTTADGVTIYNGIGYKDGVYVSGASDGSDAAYTSTGYIAYSVPSTGLPPTIYVKGLSWNSASHTRLSLFSDSYQYLSAVSAQGTSGFKGYFVREDLGTDYFKLTPVAENGTSKLYLDASTTSFLRISLAGAGAGLIVAYEPIS